jgi:iron complex transport system substrate-binding protein
VKRPSEATKLPKVSHFTSSNYSKIQALKPDLIMGFSDIQKDVARDLIGMGMNVLVTNQRSLKEILDNTLLIANLIGEREKGLNLVGKLQSKIDQFKNEKNTRSKKLKVYFEEWDEPMIAGIQWVSEILDLVGVEDIFSIQAQGKMAKDRFVQSEDIISANPDIIFGCWCGKKVDINAIKNRPGWEGINAVKNDMVFELEPEIFLQPGPAPILDGLEILAKIKDKALTLVSNKSS